MSWGLSLVEAAVTREAIMRVANYSPVSRDVGGIAATDSIERGTILSTGVLKENRRCLY
jgi:hypothetical protein